MESVMSYPIFDSGFTLWAADLDARLKDEHGVSARVLGVELRLLMERYYRGLSVPATIDMLASRYRLGDMR